MRHLIRFALIVTVAGFLALSAVGLTRASEEPQVVSVTLREYEVISSQFVVNSARPVRFVVSNLGELPHQLSVRPLAQAKAADAGSQPVIATNMVRTFDATLGPGVYSIECANKNHLAQGMTTNIASEVARRMGFNVPWESLLPVLLIFGGTVFMLGDSLGLRIVQKNS